MKLAAFFHLWLPGRWQEPTHEFVDALAESDFDSPVHLNAVTGGWEQSTLARVADYAAQNDGAVLYAHTKGSGDVTPFNARWRRSMLNRVVIPWRENLAALEEHDLVGCHWITSAMTPASPEFEDGLAFFGGNFWMARCDYLRTLPACPTENRHQAEHWIGMGTPRVFDLLPGWPGDSLWPELCA